MKEDNENKSRCVTLKYIVQQYMLMKGESSLHNYARFYQMAINGFKELNYDIYGKVTTCIKPLLPNMTVKLPKDYVNYLRIGIITGSVVRWLGKSDNLIIDKCDNVITQGVGSYTLDDTLAFYYYNQNRTTGIGGLYGLGGGNNVNGYYSVDTDKGQIAFSSIRAGKIIIEYISDGITGKGEIFVDAFMLEAITSYVHWKQSVFNKNISLSERQMLKIEYNEQMNRLVGRNKSFTKSEFLQTVRKNNKLTPKF